MFQTAGAGVPSRLYIGVEVVRFWRVKPASTSTPALDAARDVLKAARFASVKHVSQKRKGIAAQPYLNHLIEVAELVSQAIAEPDTNLISAALLHDTVEDTRTTKEELVDEFGPDIAGLVAEVTDDKSLPKAERKRLQIEHAPHLSARAQTIKIADKISNLRAILSTPPEDWDLRRKREYFDWAKRVVDACTAPNPVLKEEFARVWERVGELG
jgi:(p)ppGpp synthase/HD superfamily hydrolase